MANHASALKRIRQTETRRLLNRYKHKTTRNAIKELRSLKDAKSANALLPKLKAMLDKLSKTNINAKVFDLPVDNIKTQFTENFYNQEI